MSGFATQFKTDATRLTRDLKHRNLIQTAMGEVKCASACETKADYIVSNDASCLMHIQGLISRQKRYIRTISLAEVLVSE